MFYYDFLLNCCIKRDNKKNVERAIPDPATSTKDTRPNTFAEKIAQFNRQNTKL